MRSQPIYRLSEIVAASAPPCVSLYQPTHRKHPDKQQDPIRFRNLVAAAEQSLRQKYPGREIRSILEPLRALEHDHEFWNYTLDGLAAFASPDSFRLYQLQRTVPERCIVADSFHVKPLIRFVQSADRYQVLCLSRDGAALYEGNRDALDAIEPAAEVPRTSAEAQTSDAGPGQDAVVTYGGAGAVPTVRHGVGPGTDAAEAAVERFFRAVDRGVLEQHSRPSGLPLILVSATENHDLFRRVSHNPALLAEGVRQDPASLSADALRDAVWQVVQPQYLQRLAELTARFQEARSKEQGSGDLSDVARAALAGRVGSILVDADRLIPGTLDPVTGQVRFAALGEPDVDDLVDDLAELVLAKGGEVVVVPTDRMPTDTGAAAQYRY